MRALLCLFACGYLCAAQNLNQTLQELQKRMGNPKQYSWRAMVSVSKRFPDGVMRAIAETKVVSAGDIGGKQLLKIEANRQPETEYRVVSDGEKTWSYLRGCNREGPMDFVFDEFRIGEAPPADTFTFDPPKRAKLVWCPPCRAELPTIAKLQKELKEKGVEVYGVNDEDGKTARRYLDKEGLELPTLDDSAQKVHRAYRVRAIPTVFVIGRDGRVAQWLKGGHSEEQLREAIQAASKAASE